ncbi:alpha/beta hydrolase [Roseiarcus fermentans]|uniref:alpha/beta hydrolase n=1 Tax=Roseiarcus fermentans TaxID=1473586 RepID=UPI0014732B32|nr:alpha/beta hydrolase [Roseiarcus fermentans]
MSDLYKGWVATLAAHPDWPIDQVRRLFEHWGDVTGEPGDVDYVEADAGGVPALWAIPKGASADHVIQATHGGGYVVGSRYSHRKLFGHIAKATGVRTLILDYRRAPEHLHPAPVEDAVTAYRWLLGQGYQPRNIALTGDSAGGALAVTTLLALRDRGLPLPSASAPLSPWSDLLATGKSNTENEERDHFVKRHLAANLSAVYLGDKGESPARRDPLASPLYADFAGLPPLYIQVGGDEALLDDASRLAEAARAAGVDVTYEVWPEQQHVFQFLAGTAPEADDAVAKLAGWLRARFGLNAAAA